MTKKILIIGSGGIDKSTLSHQAMREKYGDDILLVTPEEANEQGLKPEDFANLPTMKITAPPILDDIKLIGGVGGEKSGKEKRRERRKQERKANKKRMKQQQ